jgi:hypothetical protein
MLEKFIGSWKLVMTEFSKQKGGCIRPLGDNPRGMLVYGKEGWMSAQLHSSERESFFKNDQLAGTDEEIRAAFISYAAYYGTYGIDTERKKVRHQVLGSMFPNQAGSALDRFFQFSNDDRILTLKTSPFQVNGEDLIGTLVWEKIG